MDIISAYVHYLKIGFKQQIILSELDKESKNKKKKGKNPSIYFDFEKNFCSKSNCLLNIY